MPLPPPWWLLDNNNSNNNNNSSSSTNNKLPARHPRPRPPMLICAMETQRVHALHAPRHRHPPHRPSMPMPMPPSHAQRPSTQTRPKCPSSPWPNSSSRCRKQRSLTAHTMPSTLPPSLLKWPQMIPQTIRPLSHKSADASVNTSWKAQSSTLV
ncbi:hypothetical protein BC940DRAFT_296141, partial [Gongronella butleri]